MSPLPLGASVLPSCYHIQSHSRHDEDKRKTKIIIILLQSCDRVHTSRLQGIRVIHQFHEANQIADFLTKQYELDSNATYDNYDQLPKMLKGIMRIDKLGLPTSTRL